MKASRVANTFDEENKVSRSVPYAVAKRCRDITAPKPALLRIQDLFYEQLESAISKTSASDTDIHCYKTPVQSLPTGAEKGKVLALHYEGDFIQLVSMNVLGNRMFDMLIDVYPIPVKILDASLTEVFAYAAECTDDFIIKQNLTEQLPMPMGVAVNLPIRYDDRRVYLAKPTEQFAEPEDMEQDMVELFAEALDKMALDVKIVSFVNNTTGSLIGNHWKNPKCKVGLLTGNGTSLCCIEDEDNVRMSGKPKDTKYVVIELDNGEFGINGELNFMKCEADIQLEGLNPNEQVFEKMVSGKYLGELVRLKIKQLISENLMLRGIGSARLSLPNNFRKEFVILIENDDSSFEQTQRVANDLDLGHATKTDLAIIKYVCKLFLTRSARMVAAATAALIVKLDVTEVVISIEGTLLHFNPFYEYKILNALDALVGSDVKIEFISSENGPAKGVGILAALAAEQNGVE